MVDTLLGSDVGFREGRTIGKRDGSTVSCSVGVLVVIWMVGRNDVGRSLGIKLVDLHGLVVCIEGPTVVE